MGLKPWERRNRDEQSFRLAAPPAMVGMCQCGHGIEKHALDDNTFSEGACEVPGCNDCKKYRQKRVVAA